MDQGALSSPGDSFCETRHIVPLLTCRVMGSMTRRFDAVECTQAPAGSQPPAVWCRALVSGRAQALPSGGYPPAHLTRKCIRPVPERACPVCRAMPAPPTVVCAVTSGCDRLAQVTAPHACQTDPPSGDG
jgi:hypothetical protein